MAKRIMREFQMSEISAVDRPAQKGAKMTIMKRADPDELPPEVEEYLKRDFSGSKRKELAGTGAALPDGCLSGDTLVETREGLRTIGSLVGRLDLLTDLGWRAAEVRYFGRQRLAEVIISRRSERKVILATLGHRWYTARGIATTFTLRVGDSVPHVVRDGINTKQLNPAKRCIATMAEETSDLAGGVIMVNVKRSPLAARGSVSPPRDRKSFTKRAPAMLIGHHLFEDRLADAILPSKESVPARNPTVITDHRASSRFSRMFPFADLAFGPIAPPPSIELTDRPVDAAQSANDVCYLGVYGENSLHVPHDDDVWHVDQVRNTGLVEPVYCGLVPGLHRFVLSGGVLTGNSFPIQTTGDLHNAVQAYGRAKNKPKAKAHIISRARSLGATSALPDAWKVSKLELLSGITNDGAVEGFRNLVSVYKDEMVAADFDEVQADAEAREYANGLLEEVDEAVCSLRCVFNEIACDGTGSDKEALLQESWEQFKAHVQGIVPEGIENAMAALALSEAGFEIAASGALTKREEARMFDVRKALGLPATATDADVQKAFDKQELTAKRAVEVLKLSGKHAAYMQSDKAKMPAGGKEAFLDMSADERDKHMEKNPIEKADDGDSEDEKKKKAEAEANKRAGDEVLKVGGAEIRKSVVGDAAFAFMKSQQERVAKLEDDKAAAEFVKRAEPLVHVGKADEVGRLLHNISKSDPKAAEAVEAILKTADARIAKGGLFTELGKAGSGDFSKAADQIEMLAKNMLAKGEATSLFKARDIVRKANPELAKQEAADNKAKYKAA